MEKEEYKIKLNAIRDDAREKENKLAEEYALSNNPIKTGDKFTDHMGSILVEDIDWTMGMFNSFPSCMYYGLVLKKDGTPTKIRVKRWGYQYNEIK